VKALYVTDRAGIGTERFERLLASLAGTPALTVQLRERDAADAGVLLQARRARDTLGASVPLFVNRRLDLALAAEAAGVHLPSSGLPLRAVRRHTPRGFRIGVSVHSVGEARDAISAGADLVVLGPIFDTPSKREFGPPLGPAALDDLPPLSEHASDVYAIGGIDAARLDEVASRRERVSGVAGIRMFQEAADPRAAVLEVGRR
jgi:thiamine-phosphate pyrophosphorylase